MPKWFPALIALSGLIGLVAFLCLSNAGITPSGQMAEAFSTPLYHWGEVRGQTIELWGNGDDLKRPYLRKAVERYQEKTGNTVHVVNCSRTELKKRLKAAFAGDGTAEQPDVLLSFGGVNLERLNPDANFYDFTAAPWVEDLTDTALTQTIFNGKVIGLPYWEASISGILYNKELFRQYGIRVPRTQKEFLEVCETLLRHGVTPVYLPYAEPTMFVYQFPMDSILRDHRVLKALNEGRLSYADLPGMGEIVDWYRLMAEKGCFGTDYIGNGWDGMDPAMRSGRYAMMLCWDTWLYTDFTGDPSKFGIMPAFVGVPEQGTFEGPNLALLIANRHSPRLEAVIDFITFIADPYNYNVTLSGIYTAPVFKNQIGSISTPQYSEKQQEIEKLYCDSTAWTRVRGFSQADATYIQRHMRDPGYDTQACLRDMEASRRRNAAQGEVHAE
ncbi:ABC transporter substrate-binding protein [uncultured Mailhella sp.]|uniref:ABC transporter substrate-binding protein n=1 Tax=uncultured Mailhella sp. TaxID=1981031 RepID=UPI00262A882B|nr:ABC transporter substrate-binding protein [uncultured Mailhella sp.]